jgi:hypothetical protein
MSPGVEISAGFSLIEFHPELSLASFNYYSGGGQVDLNCGRIFGVKADLMGYA